MSISAKIGFAAQTLNEWVMKAEVDSGKRAGIPSDMAEKMKALERENRELRQAHEILCKASAYLRWRNSTAGRSDGVVHRRASRCAWGRADLQCAADCPSTYMLIWPSVLTRHGCRIGRTGTRPCAPTSGGCSKSTGRSTACGRSDGSSAARASTRPVARWPS